MKINKVELSSQANSVRKLLGEDAMSPIDIFHIIDSIPKMTLVYQPFSREISGIYCREDEFSIIGINSSMTKGRQAFSIAHELYHHYYDENIRVSEAVVCSMDTAKQNETERRADVFASYLLIPQDGLFSQINEKKLLREKDKTEDIIYLEQFFGTSHLTMLIRLYDEGYISSAEKAKYSNTGVIKTAAGLGYDVSLYRSSAVDEKMTYGYYIKLAGELLRCGKISEKKYQEYLIDAYRENLLPGNWKEVDAID